MMTMVEVTSALRSQADKRVLVLEEQHRQVLSTPTATIFLALTINHKP